MNDLAQFAVNEDGATAVEYGLLVAILSAALISVYTGMQNGLAGTYNSIIAALMTQ